MKKKILVTGITGFAGSHLANYLLRQGGYAVAGTYISEHSLSNIAAIRKDIELTRVDLTDTEKTFEVVEDVKPDLLFHLAALPAVGESYERPLSTIMNNIACELNVLEALRKLDMQSCRMLVVSSADVYGRVSTKDIPIDEETPFNPTNSYAVSKIAQDMLALQYYSSYHLDIVRARPFNHIGPTQGTGFVVADFAKRIVEIEKGKKKPVMEVGDLSTKRDFTDVRDIVRAYVLLMEKGKTGHVYNIGSGKSYKIEDILHTLLSLARVKITVKTDKRLFRSDDAPDRICNSRKFYAITGWKPTISIEMTLRDTLEYWRQIV